MGISKFSSLCLHSKCVFFGLMKYKWTNFCRHCMQMHSQFLICANSGWPNTCNFITRATYCWFEVICYPADLASMTANFLLSLSLSPPLSLSVHTHIHTWSELLLLVAESAIYQWRLGVGVRREGQVQVWF